MPQDEPWVREALKTVQPATRPSTLPIDLIERAQAQRAMTLQQMKADLALSDDAAATAMFDEKLLPILRQLADLRPPVCYLATTRDALRELLRQGWEDPRFHYNRASNEVEFNMSVNLTTDRPMDDTVLPALYGPADAPEGRGEVLKNTIRAADGEIVHAIANRAVSVLQMAFVQFISDQVMDPLDFKVDQSWLPLGIAGVLSAKYSAPIIGISTEELIRAMTVERGRTPVRAAPIDLLHPTPLSELREQYVPHYLDAMRRKSTLAVQAWIAEAGDDAIPMTLNAVRTAKPTDGTALVKLIHETTGIDLTQRLGPQ